MKGRSAVAGLLLGLIAALSIAAAGLGTRWEMWDFRMGFAILKYAAYGGAVAIVVSLIGGAAAWRGSRRYGIVAATARSNARFGGVLSSRGRRSGYAARCFFASSGPP